MRLSGSAADFGGLWAGGGGLGGGLAYRSAPRLRLRDPVTLAVELEDMDVMCQPVEQRARERLTAKGWSIPRTVSVAK
jgi:hypothetical protein